MWTVATKRGLSASLSVLIAAAGCQHHGPGPRTPYVASRFSSAGSHSAVVQSLGLSIQSENERIALSGAERLSVILPRELELSPAGVRVQVIPGPLILAPVSVRPGADSIIQTVSFQEPVSEVPSAVPPVPNMPLDFQSESDPQLPPSIFCPPHNAAALNVDHVLEVRILDYRPWAPMSISLQLTARDGATLTPIAATTATWITRGDEVVGNCLKLTERRRRKQFHKEVTGKPSEGHNSPDAFLQIVSEEVATWYSIALMPPGAEGMGGQACPPITH